MPTANLPGAAPCPLPLRPFLIILEPILIFQYSRCPPSSERPIDGLWFWTPVMRRSDPGVAGTGLEGGVLGRGRGPDGFADDPC